MNRNANTTIDFLTILIRRWKFIVTVFLLVTMIAVVFSLILPLWYRAYTTILPPVEDDGLSTFTSLLSDLPLRALGLGGGVSDQTELFLAMLKSRTVMESAVSEFDLINLYKAKNIEKTIKELRGHAGAHLDDEGTITFFAEAGTPWFGTFRPAKKDEARELARDMANFFIEELDRINKQLKTVRAKNIRIFIERRYQQNIDDLHAAEENFKKFQQEYGTVALEQQTSATISAAAELKAQIITKEVEIGVLQKSVGETHGEYVRARNELRELNRKYQEFKSEKGEYAPIDDDRVDRQDLFLRLDEVPSLGLQYVRLYREVLLQEKIMEFLLPQFEQAKIQEAKDTPTVQILDEAVKPIRKHRPKRAMIVVFFGFLSCVFSVMYIYVKPTLITMAAEIKKHV